MLANLVVVPLDDLKENSGPILHRLSEDLQQVAIIVIVNEDLEFLNFIQVLLHLEESRL